MRRLVTLCVLIVWLGFSFLGCDTQKPANDVQDAKDRVKTKVETEREKQKAADPDAQEPSN